MKRRRSLLCGLVSVLVALGLAIALSPTPVVAQPATEIWDWYDLDAIRTNLSGSFVLMTDLDSAAAGYDLLAGPVANGGNGWQPIGNSGAPFRGDFDGQGREIRDLYIDRPGQNYVGVFGLASDSHVGNIGVVRFHVTGAMWVGGLVGQNLGTIDNSHCAGAVVGARIVGGLVGENGGPVGGDRGVVADCYSAANVTGGMTVGGLMGDNWGGTVSNSHYNYNEVFINGQNVVSIGALYREDFEQWLANGKFLDVNARLPQEDSYYLVDDVSDLKQLLAFGQNASLRFRLRNDLDLGSELNFYIPYLAGEFDGDGHRVSNLGFAFGFVCHVGLFGYLAPGGEVSEVCVENVNIVGEWGVGSLVGFNWDGAVGDCYASGSVTGYRLVGGLVGWNLRQSTVTNSSFTGGVAGHWEVGGLVGDNRGTVTRSFADGSVTGDSKVGGLVGYNGEWMADVSNSYSMAAVTGSSKVGGLVGELWGDEAAVSSSYSSGSVSGSSYVGGLVGVRTYGGPVSSSFWDIETSGQASSDGGMGKTTAEMKDIATFLDAGWDVETTTLGDPTGGYPFLSWQLHNSPVWLMYGGTAVGWDAYPVGKVRVVLPWIGLVSAAVAGVGLLVVRRRRIEG